MAKKKYYLTTAIPYVNAKPHIGHALEYVIADAIHRYQDLIGNDVYFVSGADENALKNVQAAEKAGVPFQQFLNEKDLVDGKCPDHDKVPEEVEEENYFFKLSKYQDKIFKLIESDEYKIIPSKRKNEILSFIKDGLTDISISRSNERARGVGVAVEGDKSQKAD